MKPNKFMELVLRTFFFTATDAEIVALSDELLRSRAQLKLYLRYMRNLHMVHRLAKAAQKLPEKMPEHVRQRLLAGIRFRKSAGFTDIVKPGRNLKR